MFNSIKTKIIISHISLVIMLATAMGTSSYYLIIKYQETAEEKSLGTTAEHGVAIIQDFLANREKILEDIARSREVAQYHTNHDAFRLRSYFTKYNKSFTALSYLDAQTDEDVKFASDPISSGDSHISSPAFYNKLKGEPNKVFISGEWTNASGSPVITLGLLHQSFSDKFIGILQGSVYLEKISEVLNRLTINEHAYIIIIDRDGTIIYHPQNNLILKTLTGRGEAAEEMIEKAKRLQAGFGRADVAGEDSFVAFAPAEYPGWSVIVLLPYKNFIAVPDMLRDLSLEITAVLLLIGVLISLSLGRRIANPILNLTEVSSEVSRLNLSRRAEVKSKDEIGSLAASFNKMTDELENAITGRDLELAERKKAEKALIKAKDNMERVVQERTTDLISANIELEREIAVRKEAEASLENLIRRKDIFITRLAHDIRNPLTPIVGLLPILKAKTGDPGVQKLIDSCILSANRITYLVIKSIKLARASSFAKEIPMEDIPLLPRVNEYINKQVFNIKGKNIAFENNISPGIIVRTNEPDLEEIFYNLISNAVMYTPNNGRVIIDAKADIEMVMISVTDTGIGISSEHISLIFDEFYKVDASRHELSTSGLGLSISQKIVENNGGKIWAESAGEGLGTTVYFTIRSAAERQGG